jgi:hypothetical protein
MAKHDEQRYPSGSKKTTVTKGYKKHKLFRELCFKWMMENNPTQFAEFEAEVEKLFPRKRVLENKKLAEEILKKLRHT